MVLAVLKEALMVSAKYIMKSKCGIEKLTDYEMLLLVSI